jgi:hypothetical protein
MTTTTARTTSTGLSKWRSGRGEIDGSKENYTRATNQGGCSFPQGANRQQMRNQRLMTDEEMQWKYEVDEFGEANDIDSKPKIRRWVIHHIAIGEKFVIRARPFRGPSENEIVAHRSVLRPWGSQNRRAEVPISARSCHTGPSPYTNTVFNSRWFWCRWG